MKLLLYIPSDIRAMSLLCAPSGVEPSMIETASSSKSLLVTKRVRVEFGKLVAVRDVSLELRAGDLLGLIGPNGAGKTTLLRALCGLQPLTSGLVHIIGEKLHPWSAATARHIGFTPDNPGIYEDLTVRDFLRFIGKGYQLDAADTEERIDFWLEQVWLKEKTDQKVKALSRGMRQRIGVARTMLPNPYVILLDEPAAGLDPAGRVQFRQLLCSLRDQGKAIIVSSHILADMDEYCSHIAIMAKGQIVQFGTVHEIGNGGDGELCRYTIVLTQPMLDLKKILTEITGVDGIQIDRDRATFAYSSQRDKAAELLAELVRQRVPIAAFAPNRPDLEEAYLKTGIQQVD